MLLDQQHMRFAFFDGPISHLMLGAAIALSLPLGGCAHSNPPLLTDARAEAWAPPGRCTFPPIGDTPPPREHPAISADEQAKLRRELTAARGRQIAAVKTRDASGK
jgi:hypothetical protein